MAIGHHRQSKKSKAKWVKKGCVFILYPLAFMRRIPLRDILMFFQHLLFSNASNSYEGRLKSETSQYQST